MCLKKCFMLCAVLVLALGSVMAWPVTIKKPTTIVETINEKVIESEAILNKTSETSTNSSDSQATAEVETPEVVPAIDQEIVELQSTKKLTGNDLAEFVVKYTDLKSNVFELEKENDKLVEDNTKLLKEKKSKFFADAGLAFGFENKALQFGLAGDIGMRFGSSLLGKIGATYMFGSFAEADFGWNIDKLTVSATVGWEW